VESGIHDIYAAKYRTIVVLAGTMVYRKPWLCHG